MYTCDLRTCARHRSGQWQENGAARVTSIIWIAATVTGLLTPTAPRARHRVGKRTFANGMLHGGFVLSADRLYSRTEDDLYGLSNIEPYNVDASETSPPNQKQGDLVDEFCKGTNAFWRELVIKPVRDYVQIQPAGTAESDIFSKLLAPPEVPGIPRPVWLTILGSVPTGLIWYGYYKFSVEEELFYYEVENEGKATGCGGYGTLFPFVYGVIIGFPLRILHVPIGDTILEAAALWILFGQVNLYRRVNELCSDGDDDTCDKLGLGGKKEPPLYSWWALLPPPLDVVVGLRQVHFLSEYWRIKRGEPYEKDIIAVDLFPFISAPRFTLKKFFRTPSMWFWFTKDWEDFNIEFLKK